jgi:hypothetical protein
MTKSAAGGERLAHLATPRGLRRIGTAAPPAIG